MHPIWPAVTLAACALSAPPAEAGLPAQLDLAWLGRLVEARLQAGLPPGERAVVPAVQLLAPLAATEADRVRLSLPERWADQPTGRATLELLAGETVLARAPLHYRWEHRVPGWRLIAAAERGAPVGAASVAPTEVDRFDVGLDQAWSGPLDPDLVASRPLPAGRVLGRRDVEPRILVHRGTLVSVVSQVGAATLRLEGRALADGRRGEVIDVLNPVSRRRLAARVTGDGSATLDPP